MSLIHALRELWQHRAVVSVGGVVAILVGLAVGYHVRLNPPGIGERQTSYGVSHSRVLVDSSNSAVVDLGTESTHSPPVTFGSLAARAQVMAELMNSAPVIHAIASRSGLPDGSIAVSVPADVQASGTAPSGPQPAQGLAPGQTGVIVNVDPTLPLLRFTAQAPTPAAAAQLATAAAGALQAYVHARAVDHGVPQDSRVVVNELGTARGLLVEHIPSHTSAAVIAGLLTFLGACALILLAPAGARRWRADAARS